MLLKKRAILILIFIALIFILYTGKYVFAKYYKSIKLEGGSGKIAKWSFNANNTLEKIILTDSKYENGKIAPGSKGEFKLEIDATGSDVSVDYELKILNEVNIPQNMKFSAIIKNQEEVLSEIKEKNSFKELVESGLNGKINYDEKNKKRTIVINWNWPYETIGGDNLDTEIGTINQNSSENSLLCSFDIEIVGTQSLK